MMGRELISLQGVSKHFQGAVFENVSLKISKGEFVYIVGDSGAGKTTLLKLLYGEERPTQGSVQVFGQDVLRADTDMLQAIRRKIGVIFQDLKLIEDLTVADNVALSLETADLTRTDKKRALDETLALVGLGKMANKKVKLLSGGEKQRVAAARALVRKPEILIADEPTGSLDREHTWSLMDLLQKIHLRGTTVLLATHDREIVRKVRRRSFVLKGGRLTVEEGICLF